MKTRVALTRSLLFLSALGLLLSATFLVYLPSLNGPFLLDDPANIKSAQIDSLTLEELRPKVLTGRFGGISRALGKLSFAATSFYSGYDPRPFKYQNLMLHLINGMLICWLTALLFQVASKRSRLDASAWIPALFVSAVWLLHPLQVSTVAYAVQRLVLLSALFSLVATVCYLKGRLLLPRRPWMGIGLMLVGLLSIWPLGLLSKENALLLAPALLLVEFFLLRFQAPAGLPYRMFSVIVGGFLVLPILLASVYFALHSDSLLLGYAGREFDLGERLLTQIHGIWFYLRLIFLPIPGQMGLFHDWFPVQHTLDGKTLMLAIGIASLILLGLIVRKKAPLIGLGILWFFVWHGLESTVLPLEIIFEHRNYLALFGPVLMLAVVGLHLYHSSHLRRTVFAGASALLLLLSLNTASRSHTWSDADLFAANAYQQRPNSPRATQLVIQQSLRRGDTLTAARRLQHLRRLVPDQTWPLLNALLLHCMTNESTERLIADVKGKAETALLRPADVEQLRALVDLVYMDRCRPLDKSDLYDISAALADNNRVHISKVRIGALILHIRLAAAHGDSDAANEAAREALSLAVHEPFVWLHETSKAIADAASQLDDYDAAMAFIGDVTKGYERALYDKNIAIQLRLRRRSDGQDGASAPAQPYVQVGPSPPGDI